MTNRNSMQIMSQVLENVDSAGMEGIVITHIIQKSNLSHSRLQKLIENLTGSGLINRIDIIIMTKTIVDSLRTIFKIVSFFS